MKLFITFAVYYTLYFVQRSYGCPSSLVHILVHVPVLEIVHELVHVLLLVNLHVFVFLLSLPLNALEPGCLVLAAHEETAPPGSVDVQPDTVALTDVWREQVS